MMCWQQNISLIGHATNNMLEEVKKNSWAFTLVGVVIVVAIILGVVQRMWEVPNAEVQAPIETQALSESSCEDAGGAWDTCGSTCRGEEAEDPNVICVEVCHEYCYCSHDGECPADHHCVEYINDTGVCEVEF